MVYQSDPEAIRNARENVKKSEDEQKTAELDAQIKMYEEQISLIEQQQELLDQQIESIDEAIEGIQEEIEALNEQKELLEEQRAEVEEFYNKLIEETTAYWDSIIDALEETKSKYEELAEIEKVAEAFGKVQEVFGDLGYTVEDVLSGNEAAFADFKDKYVAILAGLHSGDENYLDGLAQVTGKSKEELQKVAESMMDVGDKTKGALEGADDALGNIGTAAGTASGNVNNYATAAGTAATNTQALKQATEGVGEDIQAISDATNSLDGSNLEGLIAKFEELRMKISEIKIALGAVETGSDGEQSLGGMGSIASAIESLNGMTLEGLIGQFTALNEVITSVVSALGGGGGEAPATNGGMGGTGAQSKGDMGQKTGEGGGSGLTGAIEAVKESADTNIGTSAEEESGTTIGDFVAMKTAVDNVSMVLDGGGEGNGDTNATEGGTLVSSLTEVGNKSEEQIAGIATPRMEEFRDRAIEAETHVKGIAEGLDAIANHPEVECKIKVNVEVGGGGGLFSLLHFASGTAMPWEGMNLESAEYVAKYATGTAYPHFGGSAYVQGDWGVHKGGKSLVGELGQEIVIRGGRFWTVGDNGPEFVNLEPNDIVLNHLQTKELLDKKNLIKPSGASGRAYADGTLPSNFTPLSQANPEAFNALVQNAELLRVNTEDMKTDLADIGYTTDDIKQAVQNITNNTNMGTTITFGDLQFTCNGITSAEVLNEVGNALQREFQGITLNAYQRAVNMA